MKAKLVTAKFFMERMLPESAAHLEAHHDGRRHHDGTARGGVLATGDSLSAPSPLEGRVGEGVDDCRDDDIE